MKVLAITQARMGSSRLPGKVLKEVNGESILKIHVDRIRQAKSIDHLVVATTDLSKDDPLVDFLVENNIPHFRGSEKNVLERFYLASKDHKPDFVVRLTSDCPLIDPALIDFVVGEAIKLNADYCSNVLIEMYPDGQDVEVLKFSSLEEAALNATTDFQKEHVTPYIRFDTEKFVVQNVTNTEKNYGHIRMTVDQQEDLDLIRKICAKLGIDKTWKEYADLIENSDEIRQINEGIERNEGSKQ